MTFSRIIGKSVSSQTSKSLFIKSNYWLKATMSISAPTNSRQLSTLDNLTKSSSFTECLPPDSLLPSPEISKTAPETLIRKDRILVDGLFSWLAPERRDTYKYLTSSPAAVCDLGLLPTEPQTQKFQDIVSGKEYYEKPYPYAQAYAGFQFGVWAGQLGDGRVVNLFEATNPETNHRYEVQLKGAGLTPYSRFADGKAVFRSSIREFLGSEAVNALGIPTSRALAITSLPDTEARRERFETCAVVARMAETWVRLGTFNYARRQNKGKHVKKLADYVIEKVYGGVDNLVAAHLPEQETKALEEITEDSSSDKQQPSQQQLEAIRNSPYVRFYREVVKRNAYLMGRCQLYGFLNGVLNTDNTSIYGLSIDYGPFAFMDTFDQSYTPNHDDQQLMYSYKYVPAAMWWNLLKLGEDLGIYLGAGENLEKPDFFGDDGYLNLKYSEEVQKNAVMVIQIAQDEYKKIYKSTLDNGFQKRFGLNTLESSDDDDIFRPFLEILQEAGLDFNQSFRKLGDLTLFSEGHGKTNDLLDENTLISDLNEFYPAKKGTFVTVDKDDSIKKFVEWVKIYRQRLIKENNTDDELRRKQMNSVNPKFVLKNWILQEVIDRLEVAQGLKQGNNEHEDGDGIKLLDDVLHMALNPFEESWGRNVVDEMRFTGEVPANIRDSVCSCSS